MFLQSTVVLNERYCWISHPIWRKIDRRDVSGMSNFGGVDTKFGHLALLGPKLDMKTVAVILDFTLQ